MTEFGTHITVSRGTTAAGQPPVKRTFSITRHAPRYEVKAAPFVRPLEATGAEISDPGAVEDAIRAFAEGLALPAF